MTTRDRFHVGSLALCTLLVYGPAWLNFHGNHVAASQRAIVLRNTAAGKTGGDFVTPTGNAFGPIVNVGGVGDISGVVGTNHPHTNFSY